MDSCLIPLCVGTFKIVEKAKALSLIGQNATKIRCSYSMTDQQESSVAISQSKACPERSRGIENRKPKIESVGSLAEAVQFANQLAVTGDVVLLSPACASYDMFENYEQRGLEFIKTVKSLK